MIRYCDGNDPNLIRAVRGDDFDSATDAQGFVSMKELFTK